MVYSSVNRSHTVRWVAVLEDLLSSKLTACANVQHRAMSLCVLHRTLMPFGPAKVAATAILTFVASALRLTSLLSAFIRIDRASFIGNSEMNHIGGSVVFDSAIGVPIAESDARLALRARV